MSDVFVFFHFLKEREIAKGGICGSFIWKKPNGGQEPTKGNNHAYSSNFQELDIYTFGFMGEISSRKCWQA